MSNPQSLHLARTFDSWMVIAPEAKQHRELQYALEDGLDNGTLSHQDAITQLTDALTASPDWLEGLLLRAALHSELDAHADAARDYKRGYNRCVAALPKNFKGPLPWSILDNRTFLRTVAAWGLELVDQERYDDAIPVFRKILQWNPNDNQGIRYLLGPTLLRAGRRRQSMKALEETADENPAMRYELALAQFEEEKYLAAATTLRRAGIENPYIAEQLTGTPYQPETDASMARKQPERLGRCERLCAAVVEALGGERRSHRLSSVVAYAPAGDGRTGRRACAARRAALGAGCDPAPRAHRPAKRGGRGNRRRAVQADRHPAGTARARDRLPLAALAGEA